MDKLHAMAVFVEIAERGSLTKAAEAMDKSLPTIVRILAELEQALDVRLFNRTTRRIALTEEGKLYLQRVRTLLADLRETESALKESKSEIAGSITVTAPVRFGEMHVAPAINAFLKMHPHVQIQLTLLDRVIDLLEEGVDVAIRIAPMQDSSFIARPIAPIRSVVCASSVWLEQNTAPQVPSDLQSSPCVIFNGLSSGSVWEFVVDGHPQQVTVNGVLYCNHIAATVEACRAGLGIGRFLCYQVMPYVRSGEMQLLLEAFEPPPLPLHIIYPHSRLVSSRVRIFIDWITRSLQHTLA